MPLRVFWLTVASVLMAAAAQLAFKFGMSGAGPRAAIESGRLTARSILVVMSHPGVVGGFILYGASALMWLVVLARTDVSVAYPFVGLGIIITMLGGAIFYGEAITVPKALGTLLVCLGIVLLSRGR